VCYRAGRLVPSGRSSWGAQTELASHSRSDGGEIVRGASIYCARGASCADAPPLIRQHVVASFNTTPVPWFLWKGAKCTKRCLHKYAQYIARPRFVANPHGRRAHTYFEARSKEAKISSPLHATEGEFSFIRAPTRETYCTSYLLSRCTSRQQASNPNRQGACSQEASRGVRRERGEEKWKSQTSDRIGSALN
jgi:hypothetical protein